MPVRPPEEPADASSPRRDDQRSPADHEGRKKPEKPCPTQPPEAAHRSPPEARPDKLTGPALNQVFDFVFGFSKQQLSFEQTPFRRMVLETGQVGRKDANVNPNWK